MMAHSQGLETVVTIADVLQMARKHAIAGLIALLAVLGITAYMVQTATPQYTATHVSLSNAVGSGDTTSTQLSIAARLVTTSAVLQPVIDDLGLNTTVGGLAASLTAVTSADGFLNISATNPDPRMAADIANSVFASLSEQIADDTYSSQKNGLLNSLQLYIVESAQTPSSPSSPNYSKMWFMGLIAGIFAAVVVIILCEVCDTRVRAAADVQRLLDVPVLASVPRNSAFKDTAPVVIAKPDSRAAETVRRLALNLSFITPDKTNMSNIIVISSSGPEEGKTTIAVNLAAAIAEKGKHVLLVDTDLRKPSVAKRLGINGKVGLAHVLAGQVELSSAIQKYWKPTFHVLPAGDQRTNPSILINSNAMRTFLEAAAERYDTVIVDTTPMKVANDAAVFAHQGATLLMVAGQNIAAKKDLKDASTEFDMIDVAPAAAVLNLERARKRLGKDSYYYYYGDEKKSHASRKTKKPDQVEHAQHEDSRSESDE